MTENDTKPETQATPDSPDSNNTARVIPLHGKWTLWFDNPRLAPAGTDWKDNLHACGSFDDIEAFWRVFNNIKPASTLQVNSNYSIFREGVLPAWEDEANVEGGKFVLTLPKKDGKGAHQGKVDEYWLFTVLAVLGETMDATGDQVMGAVVSIRKAQDRIALWLKTSDKDICVSIGERWKKVLDLQKTSIRYQTHKDAAASGRSFRNEVQFEV
jgi:translation initiation factor 4E